MCMLRGIITSQKKRETLVRPKNLKGENGTSGGTSGSRKKKKTIEQKPVSVVYILRLFFFFFSLSLPPTRPLCVITYATLIRILADPHTQTPSLSLSL